MASVFATCPVRYTASLMYVIRWIHEIQEGLKFKWYTFASSYADVNVLDKSKSTIKKNTEALVVASNCGQN
jgi:hypothetical protein